MPAVSCVLEGTNVERVPFSFFDEGNQSTYVCAKGYPTSDLSRYVEAGGVTTVAHKIITSYLPARSDLIHRRPICSPHELGSPATPPRRASELPFSSPSVGCIYGRLPPQEPNFEVTRLLLIPPPSSSCRGCEPAQTWLPTLPPIPLQFSYINYPYLHRSMSI